jgi:hypothetical protein
MRAAGRWDVGDPEVDAFVDANIVSFAAWDLVIYLNRNPGLAGVLARHESDMLPAVDRLVANSVLVEVREQSGERDGLPPHYRLTDDPALRDVVARFITMASRREHRLEFVRRVLGHVTGG